ncbi:helix-turn-helix transcriptional regulator [Leucobacter sp. OH1287]|uniref:ArsR/SmtB family transcription factor n=1 Tax=Leucobacter sp. OH1287 TaxID=2491049 RepID=UPI000F5D5999|nr:metalloregulator ArsR/SmtB family transcription factor [Leucobacter sp. OH1287]RRD60158.1 ArsR family transcriptional regulator [Leucobacter sp. OH1287]
MSDIFHVIADATRRDILVALLTELEQGNEIRVSDLVAKLEISQPTVSKHLKVLREAQLVTVREEGQSRFYTLDPEPLQLVEDYVLPFTTSGLETDVTVEYVDENGNLLSEGLLSGGSASTETVLPEYAREAASNLGRAAAATTTGVRELVARMRFKS